MKRVHPLPSMLTLANFGCGFVAVILAARSLGNKAAPEILQAKELSDDEIYLYAACACIFLAMVFDLLDGKVARMTGSASRFGGELDSLADVVSFGIAPAAIYTISWIHVEPESAKWWSMVLAFGFLFAACACLRLARYNVEMDVSAKDYFRGLPSPGAAGAVVSIFLFMNQYVVYAPFDPVRSGPWAMRGMAFYMLLVGLLMVTRVRYPHLANRLLGGRKRFTHLVIGVFALVLLIVRPVWMLALAFNGYILIGLGTESLTYIRRHRRRAASNVTAARPNETQEGPTDVSPEAGAEATEDSGKLEDSPPERKGAE